MPDHAVRRPLRPVPGWLAAFVAPTLWNDPARLGRWGFIWRSSVWCIVLEAIVRLGHVAVRNRNQPWRQIWATAEIPQTAAASIVPVLALTGVLWFFLRDAPLPGNGRSDDE